MPQATITLETVTPLFLAGAEPRGTPELRAPAFRGALRYWLRAALGGAIGDQNLKGLHRLESAVFGSTDGGSPIHLRLHGSLAPTKAKILPHKEGRQAGERPAFREGQQFELQMRLLRSTEAAVWQAACSALELALTFGGIGLRSRRGYGTLRIAQSSDPALISLSPTTREGWESHIERVCQRAIAAAQGLAQLREERLAPLPTSPTSFPCANTLSQIRLTDNGRAGSPGASSAMGAVTWFMKSVPQSPALGGINPRQASPLWVRPVLVDGHYELLLLLLPSRLKAGQDYAFVDRFLDRYTPRKLQVKGWNA